MEHKEKPFEIASKDVWTNKKGAEVPMSEMDDVYLQRAKLYAQRREEFFFHRAGVFTDLVDKLEREAARRGLELYDMGTEYHKNNRTLKNAMKKAKT